MFRIDASSCKEVRQFFNHIKDSLTAGQTNDIPDVIILEDLHLSTSFQDIFSPLACFETSNIGVQYPYVVATTSPMTQSSSQLQLQFNFRLVICNSLPFKSLLHNSNYTGGFFWLITWNRFKVSFNASSVVALSKAN